MIAPFLSDGRVSLRPVERRDLPRLAAWRNQPDIRLRTREWRPLTEEHQERWWARITAEDARDFMFVVVDGNDEEGMEMGVVGLCHWSPIDRNAEISFYLGRESARRRGFMERALCLLHEWAWSIGLERVYAECFAFNAPSIALLKKLGYVEEGWMRSHVYRDGQRWDSVMLGVLREEWT